MLELVCARSGKTSGFLLGFSSPSLNRIKIYAISHNCSRSTSITISNMWLFLKVRENRCHQPGGTRVVRIVDVEVLLVHTYMEGLSFSENGKSLCPQILGSSDKRVLSMDVLKVVMELNQLYLIQCLFVSSRRRADLG